MSPMTPVASSTSCNGAVSAVADAWAYTVSLCGVWLGWLVRAGCLACAALSVLHTSWRWGCCAGFPGLRTGALCRLTCAARARFSIRLIASLGRSECSLMTAVSTAVSRCCHALRCSFLGLVGDWGTCCLGPTAVLGIMFKALVRAPAREPNRLESAPAVSTPAARAPARVALACTRSAPRMCDRCYSACVGCCRSVSFGVHIGLGMRSAHKRESECTLTSFRRLRRRPGPVRPPLARGRAKTHRKGGFWAKVAYYIAPGEFSIVIIYSDHPT